MPHLSKIVFCFNLFLMPIGISFAQSVSVSGKISDEHHISVDRCLVSVFNPDSNLVISTLSDNSGIFRIIKLQPGLYTLSVTKTGFDKTSKSINVQKGEDLTVDFVLHPKLNILKEVKINASKALIEQRVDKTIVNVRNSILAEGSNAGEVLEKVPGVDYSDGQVSLKGRQHVNVLIDGRPTNSTAADLAVKLQSLPAKLIDKIELIENPSSRYEAEGAGGIINIVTKKANKTGLNGGFNSALNAGIYNKYINSLSLNYRRGKLNFFGDYNYQHNKMLMKSDFLRTDELKELSAEGRRTSAVNNHSFTAGLDFFANSKNTVSFVVKGLNENRTGIFRSETLISSLNGSSDSSSILQTQEGRDLHNLGANFNYKLALKSGAELFIDLDASRYKGLGYSDMFTDFSYSNGKTHEPYVASNAMPRTVLIKSLKADYTLPLKNKASLEAGLKLSDVRSDNNARFNLLTNAGWLVDSGKTNRFNYRETIGAGYVNYKGKFQKVEFQAGVRGEYTLSDGNSVTLDKRVKLNYFRLFPSLALNTEFNKANKLNVALSKRVGRPNYSQLNPFTYVLDNYNYYYGNPYIKPSYTYSLSVNHAYKDVLFTSLNASNTVDYISYAYFIERQRDSSDIWIETVDNLNSYKTYSLSFSSPLKLSKYWTSSSSLIFILNDSRVKYKEADFNTSTISWRLNTLHSIALPWALKFEVGGAYQSRHINGFWTVFNRVAVNTGIKKSFLKNSASASFQVVDLFNTYDIQSSLQYNAINVSDRTKNETRLLKLNFSYQFNSNQKATKQRVSGAEDEQKRAGF